MSHWAVRVRSSGYFAAALAWLLLGRAPAAPLAVPAADLAAVPATPATPAGNDPFLWLERDDERSMSWVRTENARTLALLERDPRYSGLYADALAIAEAKDRIPTPDFLDGEVYNFWRDADHVRGIWRKSTLADYREPLPQWSTVLDLDALAQAQNANWFWKGANCLRPAERRCLLMLSDGGEDAMTMREFDLASGQFVQPGFELPTSKQSAAWLDQDQLLVARDGGAGTLTASG